MKAINNKELTKENIFFYILLAIAVIGLVWTVYNFFKQPYTSSQYQKALDSEDTGDICATQSGYTNEEWSEHMSHHPDRYAKCLGGN